MPSEKRTKRSAGTRSVSSINSPSPKNAAHSSSSRTKRRNVIHRGGDALDYEMKVWCIDLAKSLNKRYPDISVNQFVTACGEFARDTAIYKSNKTYIKEAVKTDFGLL